MFENYKLDRLNKKAASPESKPMEILGKIDVHNGDIISDVGSGGGYFTFEFSRRVGEKGKVYAVDADKKALNFVDDKLGKEGINNIETILADTNGFSVPEKVDIFFLRNLFHHLTMPVKYFEDMKEFLKDDGKLVIIDYKKKKGFMGIFGHYTPEEIIINVMDEAGFKLLEKYDFLDTQSFMIFEMSLY